MSSFLSQPSFFPSFTCRLLLSGRTTVLQSMENSLPVSQEVISLVLFSLIYEKQSQMWDTTQQEGLDLAQEELVFSGLQRMESGLQAQQRALGRPLRSLALTLHLVERETEAESKTDSLVQVWTGIILGARTDTLFDLKPTSCSVWEYQTLFLTHSVWCWSDVI